MRKSNTARRYLIQRIGYSFLTLLALLTVVIILVVILYIIIQGLPAISLEFIFGYPSNGMRSGGIFPAIVGTILLTMMTALFCVPIGIGAAIYLSEYAKDNKFTRMIRIAIVNLAGIPSIVYGLFGLGMFVIAMGLGSSILAASLTLGIMTLPVIISTSEEALRAVPQSLRFAG